MTRITRRHFQAGALGTLAPAALTTAALAQAGGNLAAALLLRGRGLDLTGAGDTRQTNRYHDVNLYGGSGDGPHGGFMGMAPEDRELMGEIRRFCREAWLR